MRQKRTLQISIFEIFANHEIGQELKEMSRILDEHPGILDLAGCDLIKADTLDTGNQGMTVESVVRSAVLKQSRDLSYKELVFHLEDSDSFRAFARISKAPKKSALQSVISALSGRTWENINRCFVNAADLEGFEKGRMARFDSTVTGTMIHEPTDNSLLWDSVRVMVRLLSWCDELFRFEKPKWHDHSRKAKKRDRQILYCKSAKKRVKKYKELLQVTRLTLGYLRDAQEMIQKQYVNPLDQIAWETEVNHYMPLIEQVMNQTERRVFNGEKVPSIEKIVSIFEDHTDIIVKDNRETLFGHKLNLCSGKSGLILDAVIEEGNPADSSRVLPMLERQKEIYGRPPRQAAMDGGYASKDNLADAKELGVDDVVFHKKRGLEIEDMAWSAWVYRKLRNFRAGIEANISTLKRKYGLGRCTWKGLEHFKSYVWSSIVAYNLTLFARLRLKTA